MPQEYVYMVHSSRFPEHVYKIGRTRKGLKRIYSFGQDTDTLYYAAVTDAVACKRKLKHELSQKFITHRDIGVEYFEGNFDDMYEVG